MIYILFYFLIGFTIAVANRLYLGDRSDEGMSLAFVVMWPLLVTGILIAMLVNWTAARISRVLGR